MAGGIVFLVYSTAEYIESLQFQDEALSSPCQVLQRRWISAGPVSQLAMSGEAEHVLYVIGCDVWISPIAALEEAHKASHSCTITACIYHRGHSLHDDRQILCIADETGKVEAWLVKDSEVIQRQEMINPDDIRGAQLCLIASDSASSRIAIANTNSEIWLYEVACAADEEQQLDVRPIGYTALGKDVHHPIAMGFVPDPSDIGTLVLVTYDTTLVINPQVKRFS